MSRRWGLRHRSTRAYDIDRDCRLVYVLAVRVYKQPHVGIAVGKLSGLEDLAEGLEELLAVSA